MSELATAVAMMELEAGEHKRARKLVKKGLLNPTENTLAQVYWAKENRHLHDGFRLDELVRSATDAYEADYRLSIINGDVLAALTAAETWGTDEPFAARPCMEVAFVASLLDDYDLTVEMACRVKRLDSEVDPTLEFNAIFATLSSGKLQKGKDDVEIIKIQSRLLRAIEPGDANAYHAIANLGLWCYRYGDPFMGREFYQQAITIAQKAHLPEAAAMAATFAAREAILAADPSANILLQQAKDLTAKAKNRASEFYLRKVDDLALQPNKAGEILSPKSAGRYLYEKKDRPKFRVEKTSDGLVLWVPKK